MGFLVLKHHFFSYTETKTFDILKKYFWHFCPQDYYFSIHLFIPFKNRLDST